MRMQISRIVLSGMMSLIGLATAVAGPPKVIIDTDFNTIFDDGQVAIMAAQLYAAGEIDILGFTVASGNEWRDQEVAECLKAMERMGIEHRVKVYVGAQYPLLHDYNSFNLEVLKFGLASQYVGAYSSAQPDPNKLEKPPGGFATHTRPARENAVDFIIRMVHRYPHEVSILEVAPPTDLALAIRKDPTIVPLIKQIVTMAGQIYVEGNAYRGKAEFNWWFDPEATQVVLRANIPHIVVPLDCTNKVPLTQAVYDQIAKFPHPTIITQLFADAFVSAIGSTIFDTVALGVLVHPEYATDTRELYVDMNTTFESGSSATHDYGRSVLYDNSATIPYASALMLQKSKVVFAINNAAYYAFYADLLTRPVPVRFRFNCGWHDFDGD
jgi:inosine-uridine nucleoside N-ribohydrolase